VKTFAENNLSVKDEQRLKLEVQAQTKRNFEA
jgi:hypothetical protein